MVNVRTHEFAHRNLISSTISNTWVGVLRRSGSHLLGLIALWAVLGHVNHAVLLLLSDLIHQLLLLLLTHHALLKRKEGPCCVISVLLRPTSVLFVHLLGD